MRESPHELLRGETPKDGRNSTADLSWVLRNGGLTGEAMPGTFAEQLQLVEGVVGPTQQNGPGLTICTGSGISYRRMPMLSRLFARAFSFEPCPQGVPEIFNRYSELSMFAAKAREKTDIDVPHPLQLNVFRGLPLDAREHVCSLLCSTYGIVFHELERAFGGRPSLLEAIQFTEFRGGSPDAAHCYLAFLIAEGAVREVVTFNWDQLLEFALRDHIATPIEEIVSVIIDERGWGQWREGIALKIIKPHGCASQFPADADNIVLTRPDLDRASLPGSWQSRAMDILFDNPVLFTGFSGSDHDVTIRLAGILARRHANGLPMPTNRVAQSRPVEGITRDLIGGDDGRRIPLDANDFFATIFLARIKAHMQMAIEHARMLPECHRPFKWNDVEWANALVRAQQFVNVDYPEILDRAIGEPDARWHTDSARFPIRVSDLRQVFLTGQIPNRGKYTPLGFDDSKDVILMLMASALLDVLRDRPDMSVQFSHSHWGITIVNSQCGARVQLILYYGIHSYAAHGVMRAYLRGLRQDEKEIPATRIIILPCNGYKQSPDGNLSPKPVLRSNFPGENEITERFVSPEAVFGTRNFAELRTLVATELEG